MPVSPVDKDLPPVPPSYDYACATSPTANVPDAKYAKSYGHPLADPRDILSRCRWTRFRARASSELSGPDSLVAPSDRKCVSDDPLPKDSWWFRQRRLSSSPSAPKGTNFTDAEQAEKKQLYQGWRMSVLVCAATAGTVLFINAVLTIWASNHFDVSGGVATIQEGSCQDTKNLSLWLHLLINILSTVLLSASNYSMQCLSSPTRAEVDEAHRKKEWLDIGVPSFRNLYSISWYRKVLWWALAFSGIPLHLMYNSAVFSTLAANEVRVAYGSPNLATGVGVNWSQPLNDPSESYPSTDTLQQFSNASNWQKMNNTACIKAYGQPFVSAHGDVLVITKGLNASVPSYAPDNQGNWICEYMTADEYGSAGCDPLSVLPHASSWIVGSTNYSWGIPGQDYTFLVDYCLSKPVEERCRLQLSLVITGVVIACNFVKTICMVLTFRYHKSQPLVTLGDALSSFLDQPDPTTENMCQANKYSFMWGKDAKTFYASSKSVHAQEEFALSTLPKRDETQTRGSSVFDTLTEMRFSTKNWRPGPKQYRTQSYHWFRGASLRRWLICNMLCCGTLLASLALLLLGLSATQLISRKFSHLWATGYGTVTSEQMVEVGVEGLLLNILIANSPQALLSFLFLTYNSLFTCMLMSDEWCGYMTKRKPLRVTSPVGFQRSTYRLQLPYRYGIPLLILSGTLHWLVSQSIFLARVRIFDSDGNEDPEASISRLGYSCIAIMTVIALGTFVVLLGIGFGFRKYKPGMMLVGSCSAAISAACHRPADDTDAYKKPVKWGAIDTDGEIGHCCVTSHDVQMPTENKLYAGPSDGGREYPPANWKGEE